MNKKPLYIFLHAPKCAGDSFNSYIRANLKNKSLKIDINEISKKLSKNEVWCLSEAEIKKIDNYLRLLPEESKDKIEIIYGHDVYYGVHKFFPKRNPRYFTFLRDPIERVLSHYCHNRKDGKTFSSLDKWLKNEYRDDFMFYFLSERGFIDKSLSLDKFYFIGTVKRFKIDSLYLFYQLKINKFTKKQNIGDKKYLPDNINKDLFNLIRVKNKISCELYKKADIKNIQFRKENKLFWLIVLYMIFYKQLARLAAYKRYILKKFKGQTP